MELKDYWRTLRRRWKVVVLCVAATLAVASVITWQTTPLYSSSTRIFVSTSPSDSTQAYQGNLFATQRIASYASLVKDRPLAQRVADDLGGTIDPDTLRDEVTATVDPDTVILQITATDADAVTARDIAQSYAQQLKILVGTLETPNGKKAPLVKASIVDNAQVADVPVSPQPVRNLGLAFVLGLLLGVGLAVLRELMDTSVSTAEDIAEVTTVPILGHIGVDASAAKKSPAEVLSDVTPWAEAFRVLRTNMQYVEVDQDQRVFVVSSSLPGEGKSTTAVNLAITLALAKQRVVLVECDLRRPLIAQRLNLDDGVGTTSVLIGKVQLNDALQPYDETGLQVLTSGPIPPNPSELLQSHAMEKLLGELRDQFDIVILDAPPLLPVTDAALLAAQADGALVVVRHGKTTRDQLKHAIERIEAVDAKPIGVVINLAPSRRTGRSYGYGYGYGYGGYEPRVSDAASKKPARDAHRQGRQKRQS
ncbi:tyrosine-protein kinase domain-containing protein [Nocardioides ungokensis]|uniref:polysaccharide biosynthesis tyrosine autokinase n=1 Tax=Nocardioides ungokensis TaxID=1643322 RepID=UPI0015DE73E4|nr:polysaccharide biosynthesis tyrosine autokinase [Nocardioides ungokensis]